MKKATKKRGKVTIRRKPLKNSKCWVAIDCDMFVWQSSIADSEDGCRRKMESGESKAPLDSLVVKCRFVPVSARRKGTR